MGKTEPPGTVQKSGKNAQRSLGRDSSYYDNWTTSAAIEAINGKLQLARKRARGYRNFESFQAIAYWIAGEIKVATDLPNPLPETF